MNTQTKKLSEATVVQSIADADKIPIVNSSGQTVLVPLLGLLGAIKVGARNLVPSTIYSASVPGARRTNGKYLNKSFTGATNTSVCRINLERAIQEVACYAVSFWIKTTGATVTLLNIDVNDNQIIKNLTVGPEWQYVEGIATKPQIISPPRGFIDFEVPNGHENEVIISDLTVVQGNVPLQEWVPAPEDWGGVKTSLSAVCAFAAQLSAWKGGSQHEPNEGLDEHGAQGYHDGCSRRQRSVRRLRHMHKPGNLECKCRYFESSSNSLSMGIAESINRLRVCSSGIHSGLLKRCAAIYISTDALEREVSRVAKRRLHVRPLLARKEVAA